MTLPTSDADARFDRAVERWFRDRLRIDPDLATQVGVHEHDGRLPDGSRDAIDGRIGFWRGSQEEMERLDPADLSPSRALDRDLLIHEARLALHELTVRRSWEKRSGGAEAVGDALFPLFTRDFAPLPERLESIAQRLEAAPGFLAEARDRVTDPVELWVRIDLESGEALPGFLQTILAAARAEHAPDPLVGRLQAAVDAALAALEEHDAWMRNDLLPRAGATWRAGPEDFEELVRLRELRADSDGILAVGEQLLADESAARDAVCAEIDPTLDPSEVADLVKNDHPATFGEALDAYRRSMAAARRFVVDQNLATLPADDRLVVMETPAYLRHVMPFAAYYKPARFDPEPTGTYIVTPPSVPAMMREHNRAAIVNTSIHEAYPGHHLQLSAAITNPSRVRLLCDSAAEFNEGWAFYCERMVRAQGFATGPSERYSMHTDAIWRACRIIADVKLHRGDMSFDEAVDLLVDRVGFERPAAVAEVKRYTATPTYQLSYLFGRHLIEELRTDVERAQGASFSLKRFHDTLLYGGDMPVSYARRQFQGIRP